MNQVKKKTNGKKLFAIILSVFLMSIIVAVFLWAPASANMQSQKRVCLHNIEYSINFSNADKVETPSNTDWVLTQDTQLDETRIIDSGENVTLNLNGFKLTIDPNRTNKGPIIYVKENASLTINDTVGTGQICDNDISGVADIAGGAVLCSGILTMNGGTITNNKAPIGGAIYLNEGSKFYMNSGIISNNIATKDDQGGGGIAACENSCLELSEKSIFSNNSATNGGAILNNGSINKCSSSFNDNNGLCGGAIFSASQSLSVDGCYFFNNTATESGGALFTYYQYEQLEVTSLNISNCEFNTNSAATSGGAIYSSNVTTLTSNTFLNNKTEGQGASVYFTFIGDMLWENNLFKLNNALIGNVFAQDYSESENASSLTFKDSVFEENTANMGSTVHCISSSKIKVFFNNVDFINNIGTTGPAMYIFIADLDEGYLEFNKCLVRDNSGGPYGGFAQISVQNLMVDTCEFYNNHAIDPFSPNFSKGGVFNLSPINPECESNFNIIKCMFDGNYSTSEGGCMYYMRGGTGINIEDSVFKNNFCRSSLDDCYIRGGVISAMPDDYYEHSRIVTNRCIFENNSLIADNESQDCIGGAIYSIFCNIEINNTNFIDNFSEAKGGALCTCNAGKGGFIANECSFVNNRSKDSGSAVNIVDFASVKLHNTRITDNIGGPGAFVICYSKEDFSVLTKLLISGNTVIGNNFSTNDENKQKFSNLALQTYEGKANKVELDENCELSEINRIGFNIIDGEGNDRTGIFTKGYNEISPEHNPYKYFTYEGYAGAAVIGDSGEALNEIVVAEHDHDWSLTETGNKIFARCSTVNPKCEHHTDNVPLISSIEAKDTYYTGQPIPATVYDDVSPMVEPVQEPVITYTGIKGTEYEETDQPPTEVGTYEAKMVIEDGLTNEEHIATTSYKILEQPQPPVPDDPTYIDATTSTGDTNLQIFALLVICLASTGFLAYNLHHRKIKYAINQKMTK